MTPHDLRPEERIPFETIASLAGARRVAELLAFMESEIEPVLRGERSRRLTGYAFDGYCRALFTAHGETRDVCDRVAALCGRSRRTFGRQPWSDLYEACLLHLAGDDQGASDRYTLAAKDADILWPGSVGCRSILSPLDRKRLLAMPATLSRVKVEKEAAAAELIFFVACDSSYLRRFGSTFVRSVCEFGGDFTLHVHVVNPAADDAAWLAQVGEDGWGRIALTTERYAGADERAYYATARMTLLAEILTRYRRPVVCSDIDAAFSRPVRAQTLVSSADVGLRFKHHAFHSHPWQTITAGAIVLQTSPGAFAFARRLSALAATWFEQRAGAGIWFVDQNVLFSAYRCSIETGDCDFEDISGERLPGGIRFGKNL